MILINIVIMIIMNNNKRGPPYSITLHSAKGGAEETGCSDLYDVMY